MNDIKESITVIRDKKIELQDEINYLVKEFENETSLKINEFIISRSLPGHELIGVEIKVEL